MLALLLLALGALEGCARHDVEEDAPAVIDVPKRSSGPSTARDVRPSNPSETPLPVRSIVGPDGPRFPVGVPRGTELSPVSGFTVSEPGAVVENLDITGTLRITAPDVTVRNSRITGRGVGAGINISGVGSATIIDTEISNFENGIVHGDWAGYRLDIHSMSADGVKLGSDVILADSWIHDLQPDSDAHSDGGQIQSGVTNVTVLDSTIDVGGSNAALFIAPSLGPSSEGPVTIRGNYLNGGNYTVQIVDGDRGRYTIDKIIFQDNTFGSLHRYGTHRVNVATEWTGNTRFGDGSAVAR